MNPKLIPLLSLLFIAVACGPGLHGNGDKVTRVHDVSGFEAVENTTSLDVVLHRGEDFRVEVFIDENLQDAVKLIRSGDALKVDSSSMWMNYDGEARVDVYLPLVRAVTLTGSGELRVGGEQAPEAVTIESSGSGDVELCGGLRSLNVKLSGSGDIVTCAGGSPALEDLVVRAHGSGDFVWEGDVESSEVVLSGSGSATLTGEGTHLDGTVKGSGSLNARGLPVHGAVLHTSGSGRIRATVNGGVATVRIQGSGDVELWGDGTADMRENSGSGKLIRH